MNDIDFILEDEKKRIEEEMVNKYDLDKNGKEEKDEEPERQEKIDKPEKIRDPNKKKKDELINDFLEMQKIAGKDEYTDTKLRRMNKAEIIKLIANYMNESISGDKSTEVEKKVKIDENGCPVIVETPKFELNADKLMLVAEGIFQINLAFTSVLENASVHLKHKTYDIAVLEKWTEKVAGKKKELLIIFSQMYLDYKVEFDKYLSPLVQYAIIMIQTGAECALTNLKKKKEN